MAVPPGAHRHTPTRPSAISALAAFDQARIAEHEVARWRAAAAALYAALEASGHVEGQTAEGSTPPVPAVGPVDG